MADLAILSGVVFVSAVVQGSVGFGFGLLLLPFIVFVAPESVPEAILVLGVVVVLWISLRERACIVRSGLAMVLVGRVLGIFPGILVLSVADGRALQVIFGGVTLLASIWMAFGFRSSGRAKWVRNAHPAETIGSTLAVGLASGIMATAAGIGGPPLAVYYGGRSASEFRSTVAVIMGLGNIVSLVGLSMSGHVSPDDIRLSAVLLLPLVAGLLLSSAVAARLRDSRVRLGVLVIVGVMGASLIIRGVTVAN